MARELSGARSGRRLRTVTACPTSPRSASLACVAVGALSRGRWRGARRRAREQLWKRRQNGEGRHRRHAERRQVLAVQRVDRRRRRSGQLPVHDDRAERRGRPGDRRAPRRRRADRQGLARRPRHDRLPRHRRPRRRRAPRRGPRQPVPRQHPRDRRDRPRGPRPPRPERRPSRGPGRPAGRHRHDRDRADLRRPRAGRAPARPRVPHGQERRPPRGGRGAAGCAI